jgi:hypothetical protein
MINFVAPGDANAVYEFLRSRLGDGHSDGRAAHISARLRVFPNEQRSDPACDMHNYTAMSYVPILAPHSFHSDLS